jgi:N,N'-diacetyllegionaminate synthase
MLENGASGESVRHATVIAEFATNHVGDIDLALRMLKEAAGAGAELVSVSSYAEPDERGRHEPAPPAMEGLSLTESDFRQLANRAAAERIGFMGAPATVEQADFLLDDLGLEAVKVESAEMLNLELLDHLDNRAGSVYLETGLADLNEVRLAVSRLQHVESLVIMHCVDEFPLADAHANLRAIRTLLKEFPGRRVGYSDHTIGMLAPLLAVALGAVAVEKHFTLDRSLPGGDHVLSVVPGELSELVNGLRHAEVLLGSQSPGNQDRGRLALVPSS